MDGAVAVERPPLTRAEVRARTVGAYKQFRKQLVDLGNGVVVEVRQPTIKARAAIFRAAKAMSRSAETLELADLQVEAVLRCTFVGDEPAFEDADRDSLLGQPPGGWFDTLSEAALEMLNVDQQDLKKK